MIVIAFRYLLLLGTSETNFFVDCQTKYEQIRPAHKNDSSYMKLQMMKVKNSNKIPDFINAPFNGL